MKEIKTENKIDPCLRLSLALLHDACRFAPCYSWDNSPIFDGVACDNCPIMNAINFITKETKS